MQLSFEEYRNYISDKNEFLLDKFQTLVDSLNMKQRIVERNIISIIKAEHSKAWKVNEDFFNFYTKSNDSNQIDGLVKNLRSKLSFCNKVAVKKTTEMHQKIRKAKAKRRLLDTIQNIKTNLLDKIIKIDSDPGSCPQEDLPELYETSLKNYLQIELFTLETAPKAQTEEETQPESEADPISAPPTTPTLSLVSSLRNHSHCTLSLIKKRLKQTLYNELIAFSQSLQSPPSKSMIDLLILFNRISDIFSTVKASTDLSNTSNQASNQASNKDSNDFSASVLAGVLNEELFQDDSFLLKSYCLQLMHMDDSLHQCVSSNIVTDFF